MGAQRRQHRAVRGCAFEQPHGHIRRCGIASGLRHPQPLQFGSREFSRDHAALLSNLRISLQPDAAPSARTSLFNHRLQPRRQGRDPQRDHGTDAAQRPEIPALAGSARHRRARLHIRRMRISPESDSRSPHHVVQMGSVSGRGRRDRQVSPGARDQPRGQHVGQRHVFQPAPRPGDVRPRTARRAVSSNRARACTWTKRGSFCGR